jgi:DNA-dependent RNA polymerase auxiliary subunit epsilon
MELTLKINTRTKDSKTLLEYLQNLSYVEIVKVLNDTKSNYNIEFVEMVQKSAKSKKGKIVDPKNLWESIQ